MMPDVIDTILIDALTPECRIARVSKSRLVQIDIHRQGQGVRAGDVFLARVKAVVPSIRGAFLDIGDERDGFLPFSGGSDKPPVHEGEAVVVQVRNEAMADKGARLTDRPSLPGRYVVFTPNQPGVNVSRKGNDADIADRMADAVSSVIEPGDGAVIRTVALVMGEGAIDKAVTEAEALSDEWHDAVAKRSLLTPPHTLISAPDPVSQMLKGLDASKVQRIAVEGAETYQRVQSDLKTSGDGLVDVLEHYQGAEGLFEAEGVEAQLESALDPYVPLPSGGSLRIAVTPACITVDVDTGGASAKGGRDIIKQTNLEAADALAHELRLRNLSGNIVVDFISDKDRSAGAALLEHLTVSVSHDPVPVEVRGFTRLGLVELVRRRRVASLADVLVSDTEDQRAVGLSAETLAYEALRRVHRIALQSPGTPIDIRAGTETLSVLKGALKSALDQAAAWAGVDVRLTAVDGMEQDALDVYSA